DLVLENLALRRQLLALHAQRPRTRLSALHKLFWVALRTFWSGWRKPLVLVTPRTVVNWHQQHRSARDIQRPCELARFPCLSRPKPHRRQTLRRGRIARICAAVGRPMLLAIAVQPKAHGDFSSH